MVHKPDQQLRRLREQIETDDRGAPADRELLLQFSDRLRLLKQQYSNQRHEKLLRHLTIISENVECDLSEALENREDAEDILRWINREYSNEETNKDYRIALRVFGKRVTDGEEVPDSIEWVPSSTSRDYDPSPNPANMLHWEEDIMPMIENTYNARDPALIATAWDAGPRGDELLDLEIGDISDHKHGLRLTVDGKNGQRSIVLVSAVPYLNDWLSKHPGRGQSSAPLWCHLSEPKELSYRGARKIPDEAADRADVDKPTNFTNFRKSSASYLASQGVSQAVLEEHHGWTRGSAAAARYISVFQEATDREVAAAHGLDVEEDEPDPIGPVECERCGRESPRDKDFCMWCHQALTPAAAAEIERKEDSHRRQLLGFAKENPELLDRLDEIEPLIKAVDGDPDVIESAERFLDAVDAD